ncbi:CBS domain-containing protein [Strigomonas culicis]|uniref:CBS domain-containing protein n=1 Tax=Strigomonas culicis TaxID=28005 RepID=S9U1L1_9TRYP|nr:CBS domain-containing protein [Strigomonas culicis]|eukprot:EPY22739.1 CBS domain-containing protein [Strigomonas culicis]
MSGHSSTFFGLHVEVPTGLNVIFLFILILLAGAMAGLILCVFSLDVNRLNGIIVQGPTTVDGVRAKKVLVVLERPHWLLITLLLWNDIALEMMPLLFNMMLNPFVSIVVSTGITLVFCEMLPQAVFIHHALAVVAFLCPFIQVLMWLSAPIAWPIGKLLDHLVGDKEAVFFRRRDLREVIRYQEVLHQKLRGRVSRSETGPLSLRDSGNDEGGEEDLTKEEITIMLNVLSLSENTAKDMLQLGIEDMYCLHEDTVITHEVVNTVAFQGYNFVLVYKDKKDPTNVTHALMAKALILLTFRNEEDKIQVKDVPLLPLERFDCDMFGIDVFDQLQRLSPTMAVIVERDPLANKEKVLGILSLSNVTEQLHQTAFKAEMDPESRSPMQTMLRSWKTSAASMTNQNWIIPGHRRQSRPPCAPGPQVNLHRAVTTVERAAVARL